MISKFFLSHPSDTAAKRKNLRLFITGRKLLAVLLALSTIFLTASCGSSRKMIEVNENTRTLRLALRAGIYSDVIIESLYPFEEANNVYCEVLELGEDELHSLISADAGNAEGDYDFCMVDGSWMAEYTSKGILANLSDLGYELDEDIIPATTSICYNNGSLYLAPYYGNVTVLLYNKSLVDFAGYEADDIESLEDILAICQKAKAARNLGFMYRGDTPNNLVVDFLPILLSFGGWVVDEENHPTIDTPEFRDALAFYKTLIATGEAASKDDMIQAIANGAATMGVGWPGWYTPSKRSSADYFALSGRAAADSKAYNANVYGIWTVGIPANSGNKELAIQLLSYLMDPKVQRATVERGGVPCRYSSLKDPEVLSRFPQYEVVCDALEGGVYRPVMEQWPDFYTILGEKLDKILKGEIPMEQGLKEAQLELEEMLGEGSSGTE